MSFRWSTSKPALSWYLVRVIVLISRLDVDLKVQSVMVDSVCLELIQFRQFLECNSRWSMQACHPVNTRADHLNDKFFHSILINAWLEPKEECIDPGCFRVVEFMPPVDKSWFLPKEMQKQLQYILRWEIFWIDEGEILPHVQKWNGGWIVEVFRSCCRCGCVAHQRIVATLLLFLWCNDAAPGIEHQSALLFLEDLPT